MVACPSGLLMLPSDWEARSQQIAEAGLEPLLVLAVQLGSYTDECEYHPDPTIWAYYYRMPDA